MQPAHIRSAKSVAGPSAAPASNGLVAQSSQIPRKSLPMQKTSFAGDRLSLCSLCHARFSSGARHVCKAVSRTHGASAHIAAVREPIRQIVAKDDDILDGEVVEERQELERMWNMNAYDSSREKTNAVIDEAEIFAREANEAIKELGDLPGLLDEMQALSSALQESGYKKKSRSERGEARAARRASRKASAASSDSVAPKARGGLKSRATALRATASTGPSQRVTNDLISSNRQTSPPSTSSEASSQSMNKFASVRNHRGKQWGRAGVVVRTLGKEGNKGPDKGMSNLMRNMNHNRLLSMDDEKTLMTRVQGFLKLERKYQSFKDAMAQQGRPAAWDDFAATFGSHIDADELQKLFDEGRACKHAMVQANLRLVISVAKKYTGKGVPLQDLVSEGIAGLTRATEKFDHTKGFKFSTYAHWWIRQSMTRAISEQSRVVRLPQHLSDLAAGVMRLKGDLTERFQREPTDLELATEAGISLKRLSQLMLAYKSPVSLNAPAGSGQDAAALEDMIEDSTSQSVDDMVALESLKEDMERVLETLPPREASVLRMRYGLDTGKETTLEEVGLCFNVTRERIRQLEVKALRRLRVNATPDGAAACLTEYDQEALHSVAVPVRADSRAR